MSDNYNYREAMIEDIKEVLQDYNFSNFESREELEEKLNEILWIKDSVTGNASGSYTFNRLQAGEYVKDNIDLLSEACSEFCIDPSEIGEKFLNEDWEYFDVTIRCYLLGECISSVLDEMLEGDNA